MLMLKVIGVFLLLFYSLEHEVLGQNLICNSSFEDVSHLPNGYSQIHLARGWRTLTRADLYHTKSNPNHFNMAFPGLKEPRTGNGFAGIHTAEYGTIQTKLIRKLFPGHKYKVEFFLKTAEGSECVLMPIYGLLTEHSDYHDIVKYTDLSKQVHIDDYTKLINPSKWVKVEGIYTAIGNEEYFTIAYINIHNKPFCLNNYFFDDISVYPMVSDEIASYENYELDSLLHLKDKFAFSNIQFEFNRYEILPESLNVLEELYLHLARNHRISLEIYGHTDSTGNEGYNIELSTQRAQAVYDFLIQRGIKSERVTFFGLGSTKPIYNNQMDESRAANRRVEFVLKLNNEID